MRKNYILLCLLLWSYLGLGQCPPPGNITFNTQAEIDQFGVDYPDCTEVDNNVTILDNTGNSINDLSVFQNITVFNQNLSIVNNSNLLSLNGLNNVININGDFNIVSNNNLNDIAALSNLQSVGENFRVEDLDRVDLQGLENLESVNGIFLIRNNPTLINLVGLNSLSIIGGLGIGSNNQLQNLEGLNSLEFIDLEFGIVSNENLTSLDGVESLNTVNGNLIVNSNSNLISIDALSNVNVDLIVELLINFNDSLSSCAISNFCEYLIDDEAQAFFENNGLGCNSRQEVEDACNNLSVDESKLESLSIYPNPVKDKLRIENLQDRDAILKIYTMQGKKVMENRLISNEINLSGLKMGIYIAAVSSQGQTQYHKFSKL